MEPGSLQEQQVLLPKTPLQICLLPVFMWLLGIELQSLCLQVEHFTG